jgi:hypothetical protein
VDSCESVVAWLLRINRIFGADEELAVASRFARELSGQVSESQVSRWEHATARAGADVIRRYEHVLGLSEGRIAAVAHSLYRESLGRLGPPVLRPQTDPGDEDARRRLGLLLERALGDERMSGADWASLSEGVWSIPLLLHPRDLWDRLAGRLLAEMLISEGTAWLHRCEAINRLLGHRDGTQSVIEACTTIIDDHRSQVLIEPMALLELTPHPAAARHLLRHIEHPVGEHALRAAWWAMAEKAGRGHFDHSQLSRLTRITAETLRDNSSHMACRLAAAETARQVMPDLVPRAQNDPIAGHVVRSGTTCAPATVRAVARKLSGAAIIAMPRELLNGDPILEQLVVSMLFHPQGTRRVIAAQAVAATPYRWALASAIAAELSRSATLANAALATALVQALTHLGGPGEAPLVRRLALSTGLPAPISESAAWVVGHLPGSADVWGVAARRIVHEETDPSLAKGLLYSLGTARRHDELRALAADTRLNPDLRTAAAWWLTIPDVISRSARD